MIDHPCTLSDFIIAAIEETCPEVDGQRVYMRGFARFTKYCNDRHRKTSESDQRLTPEDRRALERRVQLANAGHGTHRDYRDE